MAVTSDIFSARRDSCPARSALVAARRKTASAFLALISLELLPDCSHSLLVLVLLYLYLVAMRLIIVTMVPHSCDKLCGRTIYEQGANLHLVKAIAHVELA